MFIDAAAIVIGASLIAMAKQGIHESGDLIEVVRQHVPRPMLETTIQETLRHLPWAKDLSCEERQRIWELCMEYVDRVYETA